MSTITRNLRVVRRMTAAEIAQQSVYRAAWVIFMLANICVPIISLLIWRTALASGAQLPVDERYVTTYFVLLGFVTMATSSWMAGFLAQDIRLGKLSSWMIRPASLLVGFVANNLSEKFLKLIALVPMIGIVWWIFRDSMNLPAAPGRWALFVVSILLGAVLVFTIDILIASLAFWMDDVSALVQARVIISGVLSGAVVPLALMPSWSRAFVDHQPFRYTVSFPVEIVAGHLTGRELLSGFGFQLGYVVVLAVLARAVWAAGIRAYSAVGA
ncbi:ABC transporter permease [Kribbella sp.]|uniref:ABC transporter permease n=1 Tax=Kribbella sp. TaxID=1871183 RepID=UPI002D67FBBE|nr:ABC-2 family transporter protein [Kribbella sp.]HZX02582.1 ABC-2 family transporter protein [Kribbella sp.]